MRNICSFFIFYSLVKLYSFENLLEPKNKILLDGSTTSVSDLNEDYEIEPGEVLLSKEENVKREEITREVTEDIISEDPGYEEMDDEDITNMEQLVSADEITDDTLKDYESKDIFGGMLDGFEGTKDPLPFEQEVKQEDDLFGSTVDSNVETDDIEPMKRSRIEDYENDSPNIEYYEEENENTNDNNGIEEQDSNYNYDDDDNEQPEYEEENVENDKRASVADSESDILGVDLNKIYDDEDRDENQEDSQKLLLPENTLETNDIINKNSDNLNYEKLLSEFEDDKTELGFNENKNYLRNNIPEPTTVNEEELDILDNTENNLSELITEQLTDDDEQEAANEKDEITSLLIDETENMDEDPDENNYDKFCEDEINKKHIIEYNDYAVESGEKYSDYADNLKDERAEEPNVNFDCSGCVDIDESKQSNIENDNEEINSILTCPNDEIDSNAIQTLFAKNIIFKSNITDNSRKSEIENVFQDANYLCNVKCKINKRAIIQDDFNIKLSRTRLWRTINSEIKYHRVPRSSVGILLDGNIRKNNQFLINFALNLALLFSRDSAISLGVYRECLKMVNMPAQIMMNQISSYYKYFKTVPSLINETQVGRAGQRNAHWAVSDMSRTVIEKATLVGTKLKIIILITNGPLTNTGLNDANLRIIKRQNIINNVLLYIVHLGSNYKECQLKYLTFPKRIIISHYFNQLVYGGQTLVKAKTQLGIKPAVITVGGVVSLLQNKFFYAGQLLEKINGKVTFFKGGYVGWLSDIKTQGKLPLSQSDSIFPYSQDTSIADKLNIIVKKDEIGAEKKQKISRVSQRLSRRIPGLSNMLSTLRKEWYWSRFFPSLKKGVISPVNLVVMMDTMNRDIMPVMQKLLYYTIIPFPVTLTKTSIYGLSTLRLVEFCKKKTFSRSEDVQRVVTTIPQTSGKALSLAQHLLRLISPTSRLISFKNKNVAIIILTHRTLDFASYNYVANVIAATKLNLYIYGIGLADQTPFFSRLTTPNRVFTSVTRSGFFTKINFNRIIRQLKMDLGSSDPVLNLDQLPSVPRPPTIQQRRVSAIRKPITSRIKRPSSRPPVRRPQKARPSCGGRGRGRGRYRRPKSIPYKTSRYTPGKTSRASSRRQVSRSRSSPSLIRRVRARRPTIRPKTRKPVTPTKQRTLRRRPTPPRRVMPEIFQSDGVVGPANIAILVDETFGIKMNLIRSFLKDFLG
ncbi:hypothetical protein HZS_864, partial [Henneguya salminicola]